MHHRQGEAGGHGRVDRIASGLHDFDSGARGKLMNAYNYGVRRVHRAHGRGRSQRHRR
jgi:hypothetical protein